METPILDIHSAAFSGYIDTVRYHLERNGVDANAQHEFTGRTALSFAVQAGNVEIVRLLLENGARDDIVDKRGEIPSDWLIILEGSDEHKQIREMIQLKCYGNL